MMPRNVNRYPALRRAVLWLGVFSWCAYATPGIGTPNTIAVLSGSSYQATATSQLTLNAGDPALAAGGYNLVRVDGSTPSILGVMHDDGLNGDAVAGDGIYTLVFAASSSAVNQMQLQASAAFRGLVRRIKSGVGTVQIATPAITLISPNTGTQGQQNLSIAITGQYTHFAQGSTTASFGSGINVTSLTVNSATSATAVLNVTADAALGPTNVTLTTGSEAPVLANGFTVTTADLPDDVFTWHYNVSRSGLNSIETTLTPANVTSSAFGKLAEVPVNGQIDGQILYLKQLNIPSVGTKNVIYFATENDWVYAIDASTITGSGATVLWQKQVLLSGEAPATGFSCGDINPTGVTGTPVIDRARNAIYVVAMSQNGSGTLFQRIHALDLTTGAELFGGPVTITATYPGNGGNVHSGMVVFDPSIHHNRAALLDSGNAIYTVWSAMDGDCGLYSPWVISYNADTLAQNGVLDLAPNNYGGGMWMAGAGPAADSAGYVYVITGNGFGGTPATGSYSNAFVKLTASPALALHDYFAPDNTVAENNADADFGSAGPILLPDLVDNGSTTHHLAVGAGKDGQMYVLNRDNLGQFSTTANNVYQQIALSGSVNNSTPVYFNGTVFVCPNSNGVKAFPISNAQLATAPTMTSSHKFSGGSVISASSNGTSSGIIWALDSGNTTLYAFNANSITTEIYNSNQASGSRDHFTSLGSRFVTPMVVDGRVYFGTGSTLVMFGLLP